MNYTSTEILFDKFEVIECLKKDSHTSVYLATHIYLGKKIILKTLNTDDLSDKTILERFKREAKIMARLDHPNLIKVLDFGTHNHFFYISFEYFESRNLREVIKNNSLTDEQKTQLVIQLLKALNIAHQNYVIHRDIKPENILVNSNLELKIADFGLALIQDDHVLTQKSSIVGTPSYMSPEQIRGETLTPQSDLFSAGIVTYELFTGKNPLMGKDISATINNILNFNETQLTEVDQLSGQAQTAAKLMLKKSTLTRLKSASEGLSLFGINATVYNLDKEELIEPEKKINIFYYALPAALVLIFSIWLIAQNMRQENPPEQIVTLLNSDGILPAVNDSLAADSSVQAATTLSAAGSEENEPAANIPGSLKIEVFPWAKVAVDGKDYGVTPIPEGISLLPGRHTVVLEHDDFPAYSQRIFVRAGAEQNLKVNLNEVVGFLVCKVEPWGNIYVNNVLKGNSASLTKPITLLPGRYKVTITNESFGRFEKTIRVAKQETVTIEHNFNSAP